MTSAQKLLEGAECGGDQERLSRETSKDFEENPLGDAPPRNGPGE